MTHDDDGDNDEEEEVDDDHFHEGADDNDDGNNEEEVWLPMDLFAHIFEDHPMANLLNDDNAVKDDDFNDNIGWW